MGSNQKQRVLVVDDEEDIIEILTYNLEKEGYEVNSASDGINAVKKAAVFKPDIILLDIMMPNQDGVETCRQLRENPDLKNNRIAALFRREIKKKADTTKISIKDLVIDRTSFTLVKDGQLIVLPKKEFELLHFLAKNPNTVFSRYELLKNIWGTDVFVLARTVGYKFNT